MKMTSNNTFAAKSNICGSVSLTAGQNLVKAVTGADAPIGILECRYEELFKILALALSPEEIDLIERGYGFHRERQSQKEISADLGVEPIEISNRLHVCIDKLKRSPFKGQIKGLSASVEDVNQLVRECKQNEARRLYVDELGRKYTNACKMASDSDAARQAAEAKAAGLSHDNESLKAQVQKLTNELNAAVKRCAKLTAEAERANRLKSALSKAAEALNGAIAAVDAEQKESDEFRSVGFTDTTYQALLNVGINSLEKLCVMDSHNLSLLGLGSRVKEIQVLLKKKGLALRTYAS